MFRLGRDRDDGMATAELAALRDQLQAPLQWIVEGATRLLELSGGAAAKEVLEQPIPERIAFAEGEEYEQPKCPTCGSLNVSFQNIDEATAFGSAWIGIPLPYTLDRWECKDCEAIWKDDDEADAHPEDAKTDDTGRDCS